MTQNLAGALLSNSKNARSLTLALDLHIYRSRWSRLPSTECWGDSAPAEAS